MKKLLAIVLLSLIAAPTFAYTDFIQHIHPNIPEKRAENISRTVNYLSDHYKIPSDLIVAVIWQESQFRNGYSDVDVNPCSAGYMQLQRTTATSLYHKELSCHDLIVKWRLNLELGVKYLRKMYDETGHLAGAIGRYNGVHNLDYVRDVLNKRHKIIEWRRNNGNTS